MIFLLFLLSLPSISTADFLINSFRDYKCQKVGTSVECHLSFEGNEEWDAVNDNGCYKEFSSVRNEIIEWCPLQCPEAENAFVVEKPSASGCSTSESFGIEQRKNDWFFWRTAPCDAEETTFKLACRMNLTQKHRHPKLLKSVVDVSNDIGASKEVEKSDEESEDVLMKQQEKKLMATSSAEEDDALVQNVDALLKLMFPAYRNN